MRNQINDILGKNIKAKREAMGMSRKDLAEALGKHPQSIYQWEVARREISSSDLLSVCGALGVSNWLWFYQDHSSEVSERSEDSELTPEQIKQWVSLSKLIESRMGSMSGKAASLTDRYHEPRGNLDDHDPRVA